MNQNNQWTSGLCSCMEDGNSVCLTCFLPCVTFGRIADIADEGKTGCGRCGIFYGLICFVVGLPCLFSCTYRTKIRSKFGLPESPYSDCLTHGFCECCALCQEYRELKNRGLDPSIGWSGNMQRMMAPPMDQHMNSDVNMGSKLADSKPASSKLVDSKSANSEPASSKFADSKSANSKSADSNSKPASLKNLQA